MNNAITFRMISIASQKNYIIVVRVEPRALLRGGGEKSDVIIDF